MDFHISWAISAAEWDKAKTMRQQHAPGSEYDQDHLPHYDLLYGLVQMSYGAATLFPEAGFHLSLIDLAHGLQHLLLVEQIAQAPAGFVTLFKQADDALTIQFEKQPEQVLLQTNLEPARGLAVPLEDLVQGLQQFIQEFSRELQQRAPELLDWESVSMLRPSGG